MPRRRRTASSLRPWRPWWQADGAQRTLLGRRCRLPARHGAAWVGQSGVLVAPAAAAGLRAGAAALGVAQLCVRLNGLTLTFRMRCGAPIHIQGLDSEQRPRGARPEQDTRRPGRSAIAMKNPHRCRRSALAATALLLVHAAALAAAAGPQGASGPPDLPPGIVGAPVAALPPGAQTKSAGGPPVPALPEGFTGFVPGVCSGEPRAG